MPINFLPLVHLVGSLPQVFFIANIRVVFIDKFYTLQNGLLSSS